MEENFDFNSLLNGFNDDIVAPQDEPKMPQNEDFDEGGNDTLPEEENENLEPSDVENVEDSEEETDEEAEDNITLKFNGEEKQYAKDDVIKLAQKGLNYDRVSARWNEVKAHVDDWREGWEFLEELAESAKVDVPTLMENFRVREYINKSKANGDTITEKTARAHVKEIQERKYKERKPLNDEERKSKEIKDQNERQKKDFEKFYKEYPDIEAKDIPKAVWDEYKKANGDKNLIECYEKWELKKLREEKKNGYREVPKSTKPVSKKSGSSYRSIIDSFNSDL